MFTSTRSEEKFLAQLYSVQWLLVASLTPIIIGKSRLYLEKLHCFESNWGHFQLLKISSAVSLGSPQKEQPVSTSNWNLTKCFVWVKSMWTGSLSANNVCGMWIIRQKYLTCNCKKSNHGKNYTKLHNVRKETAVTTLSSTFLFTFFKVYIKNCVHIFKLLLICPVNLLSLVYSTNFDLLVWCHRYVAHNVVQSACSWKTSIWTFYWCQYYVFTAS